MSSGKFHDRSILLTSLAIGGYIAATSPGTDAYWFLGSFVVGGVWLSPDIDLSQSKPSQRWLMLSGLWEPYRSLSGHRGFSHAPVIGTLTRMLYTLLIFTLPIYWLVSSGVIVQDDLPNMNWWYVFLGLEASAWVHLFMDYVLIIK